MKKYIDIFETKIDLDEKMLEEDKETREQFLAGLEFAFGRRDKENFNKRIYPGKVWNSAVEEFGETIEAGWKLGDLDHPLEGGTKLGTASHLLTKVWLGEDGRGMAEAYILKTTKGKDLLRILKSGVKIGASLRGLGEVDSQGRVKPGLKILAIDLVENPSFGADAQITQANIIESFIPVLEEKGIGELSQDELRLAGIYSGRPVLKEGRIGKRTKKDAKLFSEYIVSGGQLNFEGWQKEFRGE